MSNPLKVNFHDLRLPRLVNQVLIVEDEPLIAMDLESSCDQAGHATELALSCAAAMQWLESNTPSAAILDVHLKDGSCEPVATELFGRGVPFIVCSGTDPSDIHEVLSKGVWLSKPTDHAVMLDTLERLTLVEC